MKNIIRAFVLSLVVTGAVASTHIASSSQKSIGARASDYPVPTCDPSDPTGCGMCSFSGTCSSTN